MKALKRLCKTMLYKMEKVVINDKWQEVFNDINDTYVTDTDNEIGNGIDKNTEEPITKTLIHGFTDSHSIYDLQNNQINIAPAEGYMPLGIFKDRYSEEMSFPRLFYGEKQPHDITKKCTYQKLLYGNYCTKITTFPTTSQICFTRPFTLLSIRYSILFGSEYEKDN